MGAEFDHDWSRAAVSALEWWCDAGVDALVEDEIRDWLAAPVARRPMREAPAPVPASGLPDTLEAFVAWRLGEAAPERAWGTPLVPPAGTAPAELMVLVDMPEGSDGEEGTLLSGPEGRLLDRMLAAIGRSRETAYLAPLVAARPLSGLISPELQPELARLAQHHVALAAPQTVLLMGEAATRAILGPNGWNERGRLQPVNHSCGRCDALATWHPRFLLSRPPAKAEAWKHLQLLIGGSR